ASRFVSAYQRVQDHQHITKLAEEERKKRSDYRPIFKHDGVL
nr:U11/U12 small nuclear ribonucleoprotein 48 kDa protein [Tanacetum cinerariifolium]